MNCGLTVVSVAVSGMPFGRIVVSHEVVSFIPILLSEKIFVRQITIHWLTGCRARCPLSYVHTVAPLTEDGVLCDFLNVGQISN